MKETPVQVITPRCEADRLSVGRAHRKCFEMTLRFLEELETIALNTREDPRVRVMAMKLVLERTLPTLQRVQHSAVIAHLPMAVGDANGQPVTPANVEKEAVEEAIRRITKRSSASNGASVH